MKIKLRLTACLLALLLAAPLLCPVRAAEDSNEIHVERVVSALKTFFMGSEGDYGSVNPNDSGALSVGILQWHGVRALGLVRRVVDAAPDLIWTLPAGMRAEIRDPDERWDNRTLSSSEQAALSALLASEAGRQTQDELAREDLLSYIETGRRAGMCSDATAFYYASILNQFGLGGAKTYLGKIRQTLGVGDTYSFISLEELHAAVRATRYGQRYLATRERAYACVQALGWSMTGQDRFLDLPPVGSWDRTAIDYTVERGLLCGVSPTRFDPAGTMTRAMVVTVLWRLAGEPEPAQAPAFADVPAGKWYAGAVAWAADAGIVQGCSQTAFAPARAVTREQFVTFLYRYAQWAGTAGTPEEGAADVLAVFADADRASQYACEALSWAVSRGILCGENVSGARWLRPRMTATRAESAALLMRCAEAAEQTTRGGMDLPALTLWLPAPGRGPRDP